MRILLTIICIISCCAITSSQEKFASYLDATRASYKAGKLEDAHYAIQMLMQDLELRVGQEVLKLLPARLDSLEALKEADEIVYNDILNGGTKVERVWGSQLNNFHFELRANSPRMTMINQYFNNIGVAPGRKMIKVQGMKATFNIDKHNDADIKNECEIAIPSGDMLITLTGINSSEEVMMKMVNQLPIAAIVKLFQ